MAKTNQDQDTSGHHKGGTAFYYVIALVLMALTYLEFAIVEYDIAYLTGFATIVLLVGMSLLKFALVIAIYMHLRDDDPIYTGFFSSGIVIAMGTFIALSFLFTARGMISVGVQAQKAEAVIEGEALHERGLEELELLLAEERPLLESYRVPEPKQQGVRIPLPEAPKPTYTLLSASAATVPTATAAAVTPAETTAETTAETPAQASTDVLAQSSFDWEQLGATTYANCVACHQQNGQGIPGAFPPLAGHINELYDAEGGRKYIINTVLYGLQGEIEVLGQSYNGLMAAWSQLSDEEIAATLNHELTSWGNDALLEDFSPILPEEVQAERADPLSSAQVLELRPALP